MVVEKPFTPRSGWQPLCICLLLILAGPPVVGVIASSASWLFPLIPISILSGFIGLFGLLAIQPNEARVLLLFGEYKGSVKTSGFFWVNPFYSKKKISLRVRNVETGRTNTPERKSGGVVVQVKTRTHGKPSKVNDRDGNPIEISAVVVWQVIDTADAFFQVDDYEDFVAVQSEAALRSLASRYPYDSEDHEISQIGRASC